MKTFLNLKNVCLLIIAFFSITGILASFILSIEKISYLETSKTSSACSISSAINCATVMNTPQASILGFPNSLLGIAGYMATLATSIVLLLTNSGNKNLWRLSLIGTFGAVCFSVWLMIQSIFVIKTLCPYCLVSAMSSTNIFFGFLVIGMKENIFNLSGKSKELLDRVVNKFLYFPAFALWYALWIVLISLEFGDRLVR